MIIRPTLAALVLGIAPAWAETSPSGVDLMTTGAIGSAMEFSSALTGQWTGRGTVLPSLDMERPFNVKCTFTAEADDATFDLDGECGALFMKRPVRTSLVAMADGRLTGVYDADLRSGQASLEGAADGTRIDLDVEWGDEVNGDRTARMLIEREGEALRIRTMDLDPATGEEVTTTDLTLTQG